MLHHQANLRKIKSVVGQLREKKTEIGSNFKGSTWCLHCPMTLVSHGSMMCSQTWEASIAESLSRSICKYHVVHVEFLRTYVLHGAHCTLHFDLDRPRSVEIESERKVPSNSMTRRR